MNLKNNKAITLIALVITIVVLLILAAITLNLTLGENGIVKRAKEAAMLRKKAQYMEEIQLEITDEHLERLQNPKEELFIVSIQKRLQGSEVATQESVKVYAKKAWVDKAEINLRTLLVVFTTDGYQILVDVDNASNTATVRQDSFTKTGKQCTITFDGNTAEGSVDSKTTSEGLYIELPENGFTKTNYTFVGWYKNAEGEGDRYNPSEAYQVLNDETLYAKWSQHAITITYNPGFETEDTMSDTTLEIGDITNLLNMAFIRTGYTFTGWKDQYDDSYTNEQEITAEKDLTLTAQWNINNYTITYDLDGGQVATANPESYTVDTDTFTLNNPTKAGFTFTGWSGTGLTGNENKTVTITKGSTEARSYVAHWVQTEFTVSYNSNGGSGTMTASTGKSVTLKSNSFTAPTGTTFVGWNTNANGTGTSYSENQVVSQNLTLYATWRVTKNNIKSVMTNSAGSLSSLYEKSVATSFFTSNEGNNWTWQIFYDDATYVFLIASFYVPKSKLPANGNSGFGDSDLLPSSSGNYGASFGSNTNNKGVFKNSAYNLGSSSTAITGNRLTSTYLKWVNKYNSTATNIKAVAFMMDTSKWSAFAGNQYTTSGKKAQAIGGPPVELFVKSWNAAPSHSSKQLSMTYSTLTEGTNCNSNGYMSPVSTGQYLGSSTNMWCITSNEGGSTYGYRLASPANLYDSHVQRVYINGYIDSRNVADTNGFRPVVSIPKSAIN